MVSYIIHISLHIENILENKSQIWRPLVWFAPYWSVLGSPGGKKWTNHVFLAIKDSEKELRSWRQTLESIEYRQKKKIVCFGRAVRPCVARIGFHHAFTMRALAIPPLPFVLSIINPCEVPLKWSDSSAWCPALKIFLNIRIQGLMHFGTCVLVQYSIIASLPLHWQTS
jgi:hypothetical protein